jgi:hypothetical protein
LALTDKNSGKEHVSIFMDDTTLSEILNINNPETQPVSNIQANVERISTFSREENMRLNLKKTKEMVIDLRIMKSEIPVITIDNIPIERVQSHKLLGIWLQSDLKWHTNTFFIIKKARKRLYFLNVLKKYGAPVKDLLKFYCSVIRSVLEYGDILWHGGLTLSHAKSRY